MCLSIQNPPAQQYARPKHEIAEIFRLYLPRYLKTHRLSIEQFKVVKAILACRTAILGGHKLKCSNQDCDHEDQSYNSCGNRHCPKCQGKAKVIWLKKRASELLPVPYYHVVFTIPHLFNYLFLYNRVACYNMLFRAAAQTLNQFAKDPTYLGAKIGFFGILHTWGQNLDYHVHLHFLVPAGGVGLDARGKEIWVDPPKSGKFLFPVKAMSKVFRGIFVSLLKKAYTNGELEIPEKQKELTDPRSFELFLDQAVSRKWNVFAKKPFGGPEQVLLYIGRYTHRIAISNHRILSVDQGNISFEYKDYKDPENPNKVMTLTAEEFIRRFLQHVVPRGYHRIHMYGFLANGNRLENLIKIHGLFSAVEKKTDVNSEFIDAFFDSMQIQDDRSCPKCEKGVMQEYESLIAFDIKNRFSYLFRKQSPD